MSVPKDPAKIDAWRKKMAKVDPNLRKDYFETISTEEQAYFLGLLITDGNVYRNRLELALNKSDEAILLRLRDELGLSRPLRYNEKTRSARFNVQCDKLITDLAKWGVIPNKTFIASAPDLPPDLQRHFWRGAIDGDGCIQFTQNKAMFSFCGSFALVQAFKVFTLPYLDREYSIYPQRNIYYYRIAGENAYRVMKILYENTTIYLPRKYESFLTVKAYFEQRTYSSKYVGVSFASDKNKFVVKSRLNGKNVYIGYFENEIEAAKAYDAFAIKHRLNRRLNFSRTNND